MFKTVMLRRRGNRYSCTRLVQWDILFSKIIRARLTEKQEQRTPHPRWCKKFRVNI